jgi:hypothetical protein
MPRYSREFSRTFEVATPLEIDLSAVNGGIEVSGQDGSTATVEAHARFQAASDELADQLASLIEEKIEYERGRLRLRTPHEVAIPGIARGFWAAFSMERNWLEVDYEVKIPRDSHGEICCVNGRIACMHVTGPLKASSVNGSVQIEDVPSPTELKTVNGRIQARNYGGGEARMTNGRLLLQGPMGPIDISGMNGRMEIESPADAVKVNSMNGPVTLSGPVRGDIDIKTMNGAILLQVPAGSSFEIDAFSQGGDVSSDLDVHEQAAADGQRPVVKLRSHHGSIRVRALERAVTASNA